MMIATAVTMITMMRVILAAAAAADAACGRLAIHRNVSRSKINMLSCVCMVLPTCPGRHDTTTN